jgi:hypothetical protein
MSEHCRHQNGLFNGTTHCRSGSILVCTRQGRSKSLANSLTWKSTGRSLTLSCKIDFQTQHVIPENQAAPVHATANHAGDRESSDSLYRRSVIKIYEHDRRSPRGLAT